MIKRILKILLWILISISFIILTYVVNNDKKDLVIKDFNIEIVDSIRNKFVLKKDIIRILKNTNGNLKGLNSSSIDRDKIERKLETHPSIYRCQVYTLSNSKLKVRIWQREPVLRVLSKKGYYIDKHRKVMSLSNNYTKRVMIVTGRVSESMATGVLFDLCTFIQANDFWNKYIGEIHVNARNELELVPMIGSFRILLGKSQNFKKKLFKLKCFLDRAQENKIWGRYKYINLKYNNQIVCVK